MKRALPISILAAIAAAGHAAAADLVEAPEQAVVHDTCGAAQFSGLYAGANVGANAYTAKPQDNDGFLTDNSGWTNGDIHATGGVQIGYDWQGCNAVFGIVGDWNWTGASATLLDNPNAPDNNFIDSQMNWFATLRGRVGTAYGNTLVYVTGGVVWADIDTTLADPPAVFQSDDTRWGAVGGAGAEFLLGGNWSLGTEVLYMQFAGENETFSNGVNLFNFDLGESALVARLALNYRFGASPADGDQSAASTNGDVNGGTGPFSGLYVGANAGALG
jgi:outer membrane immunogenic protein